MENSYIKDYIENLFENVFENDFERLKALYFGIDYILNNLQYNIETAEEKNNYNKITTCFLKLQEIIKNEEEKNEIPLF